MTFINTWEHYDALIAGEKTPLGLHEDQYYCGWYRTKRNDCVAIFFDNENPYMLLNGEPVGDNQQSFVWTSCMETPISEDVYNATLENNLNPNALIYGERFATHTEIEEHLRMIGTLSLNINDEVGANRVADIFRLIGKYITDIKEYKSKETWPIEKELQAVKDEWKTPETIAAGIKEAAIDALTEYMKANPEAQQPKGQIGNKVALKTSYSIRVDDEAVLMRAFFKECRDDYDKAILDAAKSWASKRARAKEQRETPGCKIVFNQKAQ